MNALFIGRFQPFHLGHLSVIKKAITENDRLFIGIGSAEQNFRPANPFTAGERFQMIEAALDEAKIPRGKYEIFPVRNIDNYALWTRHVEIFLPPFQKIYTGSETVKNLYENENNNRKNPYEIVDVNKELKISSTQIRELMISSGKWEILVPPAVAEFINKLGGPARLKAIQEADK